MGAGRPRGLWADQQQRNQAMLAQHEAGGTFAEIGAEYGVTYERVRQVVRQMGRSGPGRHIWPPGLTRSLRALWTKGLPASAIAQRLGLTKDAVTSRARRLGLPPRA